MITFVVAVGLPLLALVTALADVRDVEVQPSAIDYVFMAVLVVVFALIFGLLVPWALRDGTSQRQAKAGFTLGVVAWLTGPLYWTMAPVILGGAAALVGYAGRTRGQPQWLTIGAVVLGVSAFVISVGLYVVSL